MDLVREVRSGSRLALARLLTQVENDTPTGREALNLLFPYTGQAHLIGITGSPGTGKSSLVAQLARALRTGPGQPRVGIIAVDPSSPFSGGAILGDRVRMRELSGDPGVFIRSMASRGALGGLARTTESVAQVLDAAGFDIILIETVGAGQSEVDIARMAHTVLVVEAPGLGDDIQAIKAGILEVADILVVNKSDLPGADQAARALRTTVEMAHASHPAGEDEFWEPPVLKTSTARGEGITETLQAIRDHRDYLVRSDEWNRRETTRLRNNLDALVQATLVARWCASLPDGAYQEIVASLARRELSPFEAVERLLGKD